MLADLSILTVILTAFGLYLKAWGLLWRIARAAPPPFWDKWLKGLDQ